LLSLLAIKEFQHHLIFEFLDFSFFSFWRNIANEKHGWRQGDRGARDSADHRPSSLQRRQRAPQGINSVPIPNCTCCGCCCDAILVDSIESRATSIFLASLAALKTLSFFGFVLPH
jgi:hypothetical protein